VQSVDNAGVLSAPSNVDSATAVLFTDEPLQPANGQNPRVYAAHFTELRVAIDAMRRTAGLAPLWGGAAANGTISASAVTQMRQALAEARAALGLGPVSYTHPSIAAGAVISAIDIQELRNAIK